MSAFVETLYSGMLSWIRGVAAWLWQLVSGSGEQVVSQGSARFMQWVTENWLVLLILLCAIGLLVDLLIYLIRWQPYRVWMSFIRRVMHGKDEEAADEPDGAHQWLYADGTTTPAQRCVPTYQRTFEAADDPLEGPVRPVKRVLPDRAYRRGEAAEAQSDMMAGRDQAYHQPYYPPQWRNENPDAHGGNE